MPDATQNGKSFSEEVVWEYIDYMRNPPVGGGKERDNIKHLRGACARLVIGSKENGAFMLLGAFATLYLELTKPTDERIPELIESARQQLFDGFIAFYNRRTMTMTELVDFVQRFAERTGQYHTTIGKFIIATVKEPLQLELHVRWLEDFNRHIDAPQAPVALA